MRTRRPSTRRLAIALCLTPAILGAAAAQGSAAVPVITITSPVDTGQYAGGGSAVASFTCTESGLPIACDTWSVPNGASITGTLGVGQAFTVTATGSLGEPASATHTYSILDVTPPGTPAAVAPATNTVTNAASVTLDWNGVTDPSPSSGLARYEVSSGGGSLGTTAPGVTELGLSAEGTYAWQVRAVDVAGNPSGLSGARTLIIDRTPPTVPVVSGGSAVWTQGSVQFSATGSVGGPSGLDGYQHRTSTNGGATWSGPSAGATETVTQEGSTLVQFRAVDGAGNVSAWVSAPGPANIDKTDPSISVTSPAAQDYEYGTPLTAMFTCSDALSGMVSCTTPNGIVSGGAIVTTSLGTKSLTVNAVDLANNTKSQQVIFTIKDSFDPGAPGIASPADGEVTNNRTPTLTWSVADPLGGSPITGYTLKVDGQPDVNLPATTTSFTLPQLPAPTGPSFKKDYGWEVVAKDGGNNTSSVSANFTLDLLAPPPPSVTFPSSPTNVASPVLGFQGVPGATFKWTVTGATTKSGQTTAPQATIGPLNDGANLIQVTQTTPVGNEGGIAAATVEIDTVAPAPPVFLVVPPANSLAGTPSLAWSGEPGARFEWELLGSTGGVLGSGATPETTIQLGPLGAGAYGFRIRQLDAAGNPGGVAGPALFSILPPPDPVAGGGSPDGAASTAAGSGSPPSTAGTPAKPTPTPAQKIKPATSNVARLKPRAGTVVKVVRPTLRWKKRKGASLYNIQVFRMNGNKFSKVHSSFPKTNRVRLPGGRLKRGERYVWRVWPFVGRKSAKQPIGVSYFDVAPLPKTRTRLTAPKGSSVRAKRKLNLRWAKSAGATRYSVVVTRGKATVFKRATARTRVTVPGSKLRKKGSYRIRVRIIGRSGPAVASSSTWAAASIRVR